MIVEELKLQHFRNYASLSITFGSGINFLYGLNAQGKTNILESLYYLSTTKSHLTSSDQQLIEHGQEYFAIEGRLRRQKQAIPLRIVRNKNGKHLLRSGIVVKSNAAFIGELNAVLFCPEDLYLFQGPPRNRRRFVDLEISKLSKSYTRTLSTYENLLKERNAILKSPQPDVRYLDVLDAQLAPLMKVVFMQRTQFLKQLFSMASLFYQEVSNDQTMIEWRYLSVFSQLDAEPKEEAFLALLKKSRERDLQQKVTTQGVHKDDIRFYLNGKDLEHFGSQGQKRTVLLALKFGLVRLIHAMLGEYPILLLDDVFSELDERRREALLHHLQGDVQIFITTTDRIRLHHTNSITYFKVEQGSITQV
ncbi:MAG: DNA replication/repair protein RecF [Erysipelotrichaceae bacterium]